MVEKILETDIVVTDKEDDVKVTRICKEMIANGAVITKKVKEIRKAGFFTGGHVIATIRVQYDSRKSRKIKRLMNELV